MCNKTCGTCDWFRTDAANRGMCVLDSPVFHISADAQGCPEYTCEYDVPPRWRAINHMRSAVNLAHAAHVENELERWLMKMRHEWEVRYGTTAQTNATR